MKRVILSAAVVYALLLGLAGCGGKSSSSSSTSGVTIAISPTSASVTTGATQQFTATVANTTNTAVTWQVNAVTGGTNTVGFISSNGLYTAPTTVPTPATVTVTAIAQADVNQTASASVTITASSTPSATLVVSPSSATVPAGTQQTFTATVNGSPIAVTWTVNCSVSGDACGTVDQSTGVYTAPLSPPPGAMVSVTARANDNSVSPAGAVVTVQFGNGTLKGQYAFSLAGENANASYLAAGSISFDGSGNVTGGTMDVNSSGVTSAPITGGTYHVGADGRGNATVQTSAGNVTWQLAAVNHEKVLVARFDTGVQGASGSMDLQDATAFTAAGFSGNYAFNMSGATSSGVPRSLAVAGGLTSDGALGISGGKIDINSAGVPTTDSGVTGSYTAPDATTGRGTMALTTPLGAQTFAFYVVDGSRLKMIETDAGNQLLGEAAKQATGPFTTSNFKGGFVFALLGSTSGGAPTGQGGVLVLDGAGNIRSGTLDVNSNGNPQNGLTASGTYTAPDSTTGRTTLSLTAGSFALQYALYPRSDGGFSMVEIDTTNTVAGRALAQSGSFTSGTLSGNYAADFTGTDLTTNPGEEELIGHVVPNGGSAINQSESSVAINDSAFLAATAALGGSYSVTSSGRGTATLTTDSSLFAKGAFSLYLVDSSTALFLETDSSRVLVGTMRKQF